MRIERLPEAPGALLFDLDSTLYTNPAYASFQTSTLVERLAEERGETVETTRGVLESLREDRRVRGEAQTSLGNLFLALGIPIETNIRWREERIDPGQWLRPDPLLNEALTRLSGRFRLALVTNNPRSVGRRSLAALGVEERFEHVVGLDDSHRSKPDPAPYELAARLLEIPPEDCISIGDRYEVDLVPALSLSMGAILIAGVREIYTLPEFFGL